LEQACDPDFQTTRGGGRQGRPELSSEAKPFEGRADPQGNEGREAGQGAILYRSSARTKQRTPKSAHRVLRAPGSEAPVSRLRRGQPEHR